MRPLICVLLVLTALSFATGKDEDFHVHRDSLRAAFGDGTAEDRANTHEKEKMLLIVV